MFARQKHIFARVILVGIILSGVIPLVLAKDGNAGQAPISASGERLEQSILWQTSTGIPGDTPTVQPRLFQFRPAGEQFILVGTDKGIAAIRAWDGEVNATYATQAPVFKMEMVGDLNQDGAEDLLIITKDQDRANFFAVSLFTARELWRFTPSTIAWNSETLVQNPFITQSWDACPVGDMNGDGVNDVTITAYSVVYCLSGVDGRLLWRNDRDFTRDIWTIALVSRGISNTEDLVVGGDESGKIVGLNPQNGKYCWSTQVPATEIQWASNYTIPNSIDDIQVVPNVDGDLSSDLLVTANDGLLRLISGKTGLVLTQKLAFAAERFAQPFTNAPPPSPFTAHERVFHESGLTLQGFPDVSGNGFPEYVTYGKDLEYERDYHIGATKAISIFEVDPSDPGRLLARAAYNWSAIEAIGKWYERGSRPLLLRGPSGGVRLYFIAPYYGVLKLLFLQGDTLDNINDSESLAIWNHTMKEEPQSRDFGNYYLLDVGKIDGGLAPWLYVSSPDGLHGLVNAFNGTCCWQKYLESGVSKVLPVQDINGDGQPDLVSFREVRFRPDWDATWFSNDYYGTIIKDITALNGNNGTVLWRATLPAATLYEGVRALKDVGDVDGDGISDFAAWILPSRVPEELTSYLSALEAENIYTGADVDARIYRALLANYTRFIGISGATGEVFWDAPLMDSIYCFVRQTTHEGTYENPTNQNPGYFKLANRVPGRMADEWFTVTPNNEFNYTIRWKNAWAWSSLKHPSLLEVETGARFSGSVQDLQTGADASNVTIMASDTGGGKWSAITNVTVPTNLGLSHNLGGMDFALTQRDRVSALKLQTAVTVNTSLVGAQYTYSLYNHSGGNWVLCDWSGAPTWSGQYPMLQGNFTQVADGGFRSSYTDFNFATGQFRNDTTYVIARGTADADPAVNFAASEKTVLSDFLDQDGNVRVQMNVSASTPFNISWDAVGVAPFCWGLVSPAFDEFYVFNYRATSGDKFKTTHLLDLEVADFQVINGSGDDDCLDMVVAIGRQFDSTPRNSISTRLSLFDLKNKHVSTKWSLNFSFVPRKDVAIRPLNTSLNAWILTGSFGAGLNTRFSHNLVNEPYWTTTLSPLANYSESQTRVDYTWSLPAGMVGELPSIIPLNASGAPGIVIGASYDQTSGVATSIVVKNPVSNASSCTIPTGNALAIDPLNHRHVTPGDYFQIRWAYGDLNNDGYLDHVVLGNTTRGYEIAAYSGHVIGGGVQLLFRKVYVNVALPTLRLGMLHVPFALAGDISGDGVFDGIIGSQIAIGSFTYCAGTSLDGLDLGHSSGDSVQNLTGWPWQMDAVKCSLSIPSDMGWEFFKFTENTADLTGDGKCEVAVTRNAFQRTGIHYISCEVTELLDVSHKQVICRVQAGVDNVSIIPDLDEDGTPEAIFARGGILRCINPCLGVNITSHTSGQTLPSRDLKLEWSSKGDRAYFAVIVDGFEYGRTNESTFQLTLGDGTKTIQVMVVDPSEMVACYSQIIVLVPSDAPNYFIIVILAIGIITLSYLYLMKNRNDRQLVLIQRGRKLSELEVLQPRIESNMLEGSVISTRGLKKIYPPSMGNPRVVAVDGIDLDVKPGVHGFLGPNGAGKTSAINMLVGIAHITAGSVNICGHPAGSIAAKKCVGFLKQNPFFPEHLTGEEYLADLGRLGGLPRRIARKRAQELLDLLDLWDARSRSISTYSGGMRQKLGIAAALIHSPRVLVLDEPTADLDPEGKLEVIKIVQKLSDLVTIFVSSHALSEVEQMCDSITLIDKGKIIETGNLAALKTKYSGVRMVLRTSDNARGLELVRSLDGVKLASIDISQGVLTITPASPETIATLQIEIPKIISDQGIAIQNFSQQELSLEKLYFEMKEVNRRLQEASKNGEDI